MNGDQFEKKGVFQPAATSRSASNHGLDFRRLFLNTSSKKSGIGHLEHHDGDKGLIFPRNLHSAAIFLSRLLNVLQSPSMSAVSLT